MRFTFVAADCFGHTVVLSGEILRPSSVTGSFDRESFNSVEQTYTVMVVSFMVAHLDMTVEAGLKRLNTYCAVEIAGVVQVALEPGYDVKQLMEKAGVSLPTKLHQISRKPNQVATKSILQKGRKHQNTRT